MKNARFVLLMVACSIVDIISANPLTLNLKGKNDKLAYKYLINRIDSPLCNTIKNNYYQSSLLHLWNRKSIDTLIFIEYSDLSNKFNYRVEVIRGYNKETESEIINKIKVVINYKSTKIVSQVIETKYEVFSLYSFGNEFTDSTQSRSYITDARKNMEPIDGDYGDFVVNDFNFDGREDFAIKIHSGGRNGPMYEFYTANTNSTFSIDNFLTKSIRIMPKFDPVKKRLESSMVLDASGDARIISYRFDVSQMKWLMVSNKIYQFANNEENKEEKGCDCPSNFRQPTASDFFGTYIRYKGKDGHTYYEVDIRMKSKNPGWLKSITYSSLSSSGHRYPGEYFSSNGYTAYTSGVKVFKHPFSIKIKGCNGDETFYMRPEYSCCVNMGIASAKLFFRDLSAKK